MSLPTKTHLRPQQDATGAWHVPGLGSLGEMHTIEEDGLPRDWLEDLNLPRNWDDLELLATADAFSSRWVRFILFDESVTRFQGRFRMQPRRIGHMTDGIPLTLGHLALVVGECRNVRLARPGEIPDVEGYALIGEAQFYESALALAAWVGIQRKIFGHVCAVVLKTPDMVVGTGGVGEVAVVDVPGCPGARILETWEDAQ